MQKEKDLKIFVIIVTYKGIQWYDRCFTSLRQSSIPVQTIVIDNASNDGSVEYIKEHHPEIILIESKENLGFGKANNLAMRYALDHNCDYVFLLNQDTWLPESNAIEKLISVSITHQEYGILSPLHMMADEKTLSMMLEYQNNHTSMAILTDMLKGEMKDVYETNYVNAAGWLLPRNTLESVGGFDPIYQHYEEDDDYLNRVAYHGLKVGICPMIKMVHDHHESEMPFSNNLWLYHHQQEILVKLTNLNVNNPISKEFRYYLRKALKSIVSGNLMEFGKWCRDWSFVRKMRPLILNSRNQNRQVAPSWLLYVGED